MRHGIPAAVLTAVGLIYCWPLLSQLGTSIPGGPTDRDVATMVWNVGWVGHALSSGAPLLRSEDVLVPFGADLRLHTYGLLQGVLAFPLLPLAGVVGAFNLMLVGTLVLNGVLAYALTERETGNRWAALVAATCFMLATPLLDQLRVGRPTFASLWLVAAVLLVMRALLKRPRLWQGLALGAVLLAALLTDLQISLFSVLWLVVYAVWRLRPSHVLPLALGGVVTAIGFLALFAGAFATGDYPRPSLDDMAVYSFRFWDFADPSVLPHLFGIELLIALLLWRRPTVWLAGALVFELLALGPYLQPTHVPLPFAAFGVIPPLAQFRTPYRLAMPAALGLAVVLAMVLARWRVSSRIAVPLVLARLIAALVLEPFPTQTYSTYQLYEQLAHEPERFTLLEVPFGIRSGLERIGDGGEVLEYYQHIHGKPLLNGMVARLPTSVFAAYRTHPSLLVLSGENVSASVEDLQSVLGWTGTRYILLHGSMLEADQRARIEALVAQAATLVGAEDDLALYRVNGH